MTEDYLCPNCCTPWKCNGPHIPEPAPQPSAEPVAWMVTDIAGRRFLFRLEKPVVYEGETLIPLYPAPQPAKQPISDVTEAVTKTIIEVEKLLCEKLGRKWSAAGISIASLVDELAARAAPEAPQPTKRVPLTEDQIDALWLDSISGPLTASKFARAIEKAHGITGETE